MPPLAEEGRFNNLAFHPGRELRKREPELAAWLERHDAFEVEPGGRDAGRAVRKAFRQAAAAPLLTPEELAALGFDVEGLEPPEAP
jgi:hypothetical protein